MGTSETIHSFVQHMTLTLICSLLPGIMCGGGTYTSFTCLSSQCGLSIARYRLRRSPKLSFYTTKEEEGYILHLHFAAKKPRCSKVKQLAQGHAAGKWQSGNLISGSLMPGFLYFIVGYVTALSRNEESWKVFKAKHLRSERRHAATVSTTQCNRRDSMLVHTWLLGP